MRKLVSAVAATTALVLGAQNVVELKDNGSALINPGMGWVMHYYDNGARYGSTIATGDDLSWFPGCSVAYFRLPWAHLEPEEGKFNWNAVDTPAQQWISRGGQIAFRITCSETMKEATPEWVAKAGAKTIRWQWDEKNKKWGRNPEGKFWECVPDDPVYLEKLGNFLKAFAARYDGRKEVAFVDIGSVGIWGEGHTGRTIQLSSEETQRIVIKHTDLHLKYFKKTRLIVNDDFTADKVSQTSPAIEYALSKGLGWRDDSIMVQPKFWFHEEQAGLFWPQAPTIIESAHYQYAKDKKLWSGKTLLDAIESHHASYCSIHGNPKEIFEENREGVSAINKRLGYRFQARRIVYPKKVVSNKDPKEARPFEVIFSFANAGVAPSYSSAYPCLTLKTAAGGIAAVLSASEFDISKLPVAESGKAVEKTRSVKFTLGRWQRPILPPGIYEVFLSVGRVDGTPVYELPYDGDDGQRRYRIGRIEVVEAL